MAVDDRFIIQRQGRDFVLYAGLIGKATDDGLKGINTELAKLTMEEDGITPKFALVKATVEMEDGRIFTGIGDASSQNVGKNIAPHLIRMAETRAKARALRDATNISMTAYDEINPDDDSNDTPAPKQNITGQQRKRIDELAKSLYGNNDDDVPPTEYLQKHLKQPLEQFSESAAANLIAKLEERVEDGVKVTDAPAPEDEG